MTDKPRKHKQRPSISHRTGSRLATSKDPASPFYGRPKRSSAPVTLAHKGPVKPSKRSW
jgi:hypothetical protein